MDNYDDILAQMKQRYSELSGNEVPALSDIDLRMKTLAGEIYNDRVNLEFIKRQMFVSTACGEYLDLHASDRGLSRKPGVKATGRVSFLVSTPPESNITIPAGTVVATAGSTSYRFLTDSDAVLETGRTSVEVGCTAEKVGIEGNVSKRAVCVIVTNIPGIESVVNGGVFTGGADEESDDNLRKRILDTYTAISNGTNKAYYKRLALSVPGVNSAGVRSLVRGRGTVDVYIASYKSAASDSLVSQVQTLLNKQRELNVNVQVSKATPVEIEVGASVILEEGYSLDKVTENIRASVSDYIDSLEIGDSVSGNHLGRAILSAQGVYDYAWSDLYPNSYSLSADSFAVLAGVYITEGTQ